MAGGVILLLLLFSMLEDLCRASARLECLFLFWSGESDLSEVMLVVPNFLPQGGVS